MELVFSMNMKTTHMVLYLSLGYFLLCFQYVKQVRVGKMKKGRDL